MSYDERLCDRCKVPLGVGSSVMRDGKHYHLPDCQTKTVSAGGALAGLGVMVAASLFIVAVALGGLWVVVKVIRMAWHG